MTVHMHPNLGASENSVVVHKGKTDGETIATNLSTEELITQGSASVAHAVTMFGSRIAVWPILSSIHCEKDVMSLNADVQSDVVVPERHHDKLEIGTFGPETLIRELKYSELEFEEHLSCVEDDALEAEIRALAQWREESSGRLTVLERRAAWSLLGMEEGSVTATEVRRAFKKALLVLHPDKGGNPRRFQMLQDMKRVLMANFGDSSKQCVKDDADSASETESQSHVEAQTSELENVGGNERVHLQARRRELRNAVRELQTRCKELNAEIKKNGFPGVSDHSDVLSQRLNVFIEGFMASNFRDRNLHSESECQDIVTCFVDQAGELIGAAAAYNPGLAAEIISRKFCRPLQAVVESPYLHSRCAALIGAIHQVPPFLESHVDLDEAVHYGEIERTNGSPSNELCLPIAGQSCEDSGSSNALIPQRNGDGKFERYVGGRRPDGSAIYCIACDCWVSLDQPFDFQNFVAHCETDVMHQAVT